MESHFNGHSREKRLNNTWINISICNEGGFSGDVFLWFHARAFILGMAMAFIRADSWIVLEFLEDSR